MDTFEPIWSGQVDLAAPGLPERVVTVAGLPFTSARILVRAGGTPLGFLSLDTPDGIVDLGRVVASAQATYGSRVASTLADAAWKSANGPRVSIVVCTHNRASLLRRTLDSFGALAYSDLEIIVVDNAPDDEAAAKAVREFSEVDSRIRYVREPRKGLSCARNRGVAEAVGDLIAFTDDDVRVDPLWIHGLLRGFERRPDVACTTGLVASSSLERPAEQFFDRRAGWASSCDQRTFTLARGPLDSPLHPFSAGIYGAGASFAVEATVVKALGGFDECLGAGSPTRGGEDLDFFVRLLMAGHALSYEPSALAWHDHRVDEESLRTQMYAYGMGLTAYLTKHLLYRRSRRAMMRRAIGGLGRFVHLARLSRSASDEAAIQTDVGGVELRGMLAGPTAYLRARRCQAREHLRAVAP